MSGQTIFTPFDLSDAIPAGKRRFWKQVLPNTTINYKGTKVKFDRQYHTDLTDSFASKAFDQVPVVFADGENRHNMDPRNFGGDVLNMETREDGLYALIQADEDAAKAIERNPKLGVSARIRQMVEKADGRKFGKAVEHLCLTMNPRVTGMSPWQAVDLSDEDTDTEVVDLTAAHYEEGTTVGKTVTTKTRKATSSKRRKDDDRTIDLSVLDDDEFQRLLDLAETAIKDAEVEDEEVEDEDPDDLEVETPTRKRRRKSKKRITIEKDEEDEDPEDEEPEEDEDEDIRNLSDAAYGREALGHVQRMRYDLAESKWKGERGKYLASGVPAFLLDLAEPVLSLPDAMTIDLSDDETLDATETIRQMLDGVKGIVDLTGEIGHQIDLTVDEDTRSEADAFLDEWDNQFG